MSRPLALPVESFKLVPFFAPIDINGADFWSGWVNMAEWNHATILLMHGAGTAAQAVTILQAQDNAATAIKAVTFTEAYGATSSVGNTTAATTQAAAGADLLKRFTVASNTFTLGSIGTTSSAASVYNIVEIDVNQLDVGNGFNHIAVKLASVSTATVFAGVFLLTGNRHPQGFLPATAAGVSGGPLTILG